MLNRYRSLCPYRLDLPSLIHVMDTKSRIFLLCDGQPGSSTTPGLSQRLQVDPLPLLCPFLCSRRSLSTSCLRHYHQDSNGAGAKSQLSPQKIHLAAATLTTNCLQTQSASEILFTAKC